MATSDPEAPQERRKKTLWLLIAGAASLLIPLAGAVYLHWSENAGTAGPSGRSDIFERREGEDRKIVPTQTAVVLTPPALMAPSGAGAGAAAAISSLDFIKSNADMQARFDDSKAPASAPMTSTAPAAATAPAAVSTAAKKAAPAGQKAFSMPKLQSSRGFTNFGSTGANGAGNNGVQAGTAGGQSAQDALKNLPSGSENNPLIQQYLKAHAGQ